MVTTSSGKEITHGGERNTSEPSTPKATSTGGGAKIARGGKSGAKTPKNNSSGGSVVPQTAQVPSVPKNPPGPPPKVAPVAGGGAEPMAMMIGQMMQNFAEFQSRSQTDWQHFVGPMKDALNETSSDDSRVQRTDRWTPRSWVVCCECTMQAWQEERVQAYTAGDA